MLCFASRARVFIIPFFFSLVLPLPNLSHRINFHPHTSWNEMLPFPNELSNVEWSRGILFIYKTCKLFMKVFLLLLMCLETLKRRGRVAKYDIWWDLILPWELKRHEKTNTRFDIIFCSKQCLKIAQNVSFEFFILTFSTNFCLIKSCLSGNTVWTQALGFSKTRQIGHFWHF